MPNFCKVIDDHIQFSASHYIDWFCECFVTGKEDAINSLRNMIDQKLIENHNDHKEETYLNTNRKKSNCSPRLKKTSENIFTKSIEESVFIIIIDFERFLNDKEEHQKLDKLLFTDYLLLKLIANECRKNSDVELTNLILNYCEFNGLTVSFFNYLFKQRMEETSKIFLKNKYKN